MKNKRGKQTNQNTQNPTRNLNCFFMQDTDHKRAIKQNYKSLYFLLIKLRTTTLFFVIFYNHLTAVTFKWFVCETSFKSVLIFKQLINIK